MASDQDIKKSGDTQFCAHCGTENSKDVYSCDRCGERIYLPDINLPPPLGLVECQQCLTANEARASYCVKCGSSLSNAARISVLGGGDGARRAPHSEPGGIRVSQRGRDPAVRRAPEPKRVSPDRVPSEPAKPPPATRARQPEQEQEQREAARAKAGEQERQQAESAEGENTSGTRSARLPQSARGWNTAAFLIGPVWGPANGVWIGVIGLAFFLIPDSLLTLIPDSLLTLGLRFTLYLAYGAFLGFRGNEMAWRARRWASLEQFKKVQQQWMLLALVVNLVLLFVIPILTR